MSDTVQDVPVVEEKSKLDLRILLLALATFVLGTDVLIVVGVLPTIAHELHVTEGAAGQLITVFSLVYGLGGPVLAALVGRWRRSRVIIVALGAFCIVNIGSALSPTFAALLITRILGGGFAALISPLAYATAVALAPPQKRGQALALVLSGATIANIVGGPLGTWIGEHVGWRVSFGLIALVAGIACMVLQMIGLPDSSTSQSLSLRARLAPIGEPRLVLALAPAFFATVGFSVVYNYIAPLLQSNLQISDISILLVVLGLGTVTAAQVVGRITDRFGSTRLLVVFLVAQLVIEVSIAYTTASWVGAVLALFIWGASGPSFFIAQQHRLLNMAPEHANVITALNSSMNFLGIACGAGLGGVALSYVQVTRLGWVGTVCGLVGMVVLLISFRVSGGKPTRE
ncbi:MAG: MFS transporter [Ktedonobacteraceae bacterium]|nr:MFS transporter [Ktedonobacteraceae bacterium]